MLVLVCGVVALAGAPGILLYAGGPWRAVADDLAVAGVFWALAGLVGVATGALPGGFAVLVPAAGFVMTTGVADALAERVPARGIRIALEIGFGLLVFLPLALLVFGWGGTWLYREFGALDFGGAVPVAVGAGVFLIVFSMVVGERSAGERVLALRGAMLFAVAATGCAVGLELRVDELTPAIALHMIMTPAVAILAAAGIERVKRGRNTREGLAAGTLAGTAAALAACAYLETVTALMLGLVVGAVAELARRGDSAALRFAVPLLVGGITGLLYLGLFGLGPGFIYSGQLVLLGQQAILCAGAIGYAAIVAAFLLVPVRRRIRALPGRVRPTRRRS
jgi:Amt family ammonium transporter